MKQKKLRKAALRPKVRRTLAYINKNFRQSISLEGVADVVGMSKCSFSRLFKKVTGMTFTQYLNWLRLEEASTLLLTSHFYIFEVAHKVGFRSLSYFRSVFKREYGCSPREYRDTFSGL